LNELLSQALYKAERVIARPQRGKPQPKTNWPQRNTRITKNKECKLLSLCGNNVFENAKLFRIALQWARGWRKDQRAALTR
jgi:hypothetical protein